MRRGFRVGGLVFVLAVAVEIAAFVGVWHLIGFGWTLLALVALSGLGSVLMRREGALAWRHWRSVAAAGERPGPQLTRSVVGLLGAVLVAVPGFVTGVIGLALFLPPVRALAGMGATAYATRRLAPNVVGEMFGPRRVKVKTGPVTRTRSGPPDGRSPMAGPPIEGEIV